MAPVTCIWPHCDRPPFSAVAWWYDYPSISTPSTDLPSVPICRGHFPRMLGNGAFWVGVR